MDLHRELQNPEGEAQTLNNIAVILKKNDPEEAIQYCKRALSISESIQDKDGQATHLHNLGAIYSELNELEVAVGYYSAALEIRREIEDQAGTVNTLYNLAMIWANLRDLSLAEDLLGEAIHLDDDHGLPTLERDREALSEIQRHLADLNHSAR